MTETTPENTPALVERQSLDVDIACVGFGPAVGGFLTTLTRGLVGPDGAPAVESRTMPGMPPQVICYERADDIGFGVSGAVTRGRGIKATFPDLDLSQIPMAAPVTAEKLVYLLDPIGASRRSVLLRAGDLAIKGLKRVLPYREHALEMPYIPPFMNKHDGFVMAIGQFNQWVGQQVMGGGLAQVWPATPVSEALIEQGKVVGVRLADQGTDKQGRPEAGFLPGMDIRAALTVVGDGPVGAIGRQLDCEFGMPVGHHLRDWAVGMKMVVDLPETCDLAPGTVVHTFGYPEPEIFGFLYVLPERVATLGIFVPSWFDTPVRTSYRYLQYWMRHPYLWRWLSGGALRSWGAKSLQESGREGEPRLVGDGYARIGEGSGSTNVLSGSGVDEAWTTGTQLAEAVIELLKEGKPFTRENLEASYVARRRRSWVEREARVAERSRRGFQQGVVAGLVGMALAGFSNGRIAWPGQVRHPRERIPSLEEYFAGRVNKSELDRVRRSCKAQGKSLHEELMKRVGWPEIEFDGRLLISQQDALLRGGKVQAPAGYADHVVFLYPHLCETCGTQICAEVCSAQAITVNPEGAVPLFDREKCVHCGACLWNCAMANPDDPESGNVRFKAGAGGLHSVEN